jgi:hypothetical protein
MTMSNNINVTPAQNVAHGDYCDPEWCEEDVRWAAVEALLVKMGVYDAKADLIEQLLEHAAGLVELDRRYTDDEYQLIGEYVRFLVDLLNLQGWLTSARDIVEIAEGIARATRKADVQYHRPPLFWFQASGTMGAAG